VSATSKVVCRVFERSLNLSLRFKCVSITLSCYVQLKEELVYGDKYKEITAIALFSDFYLKKFNLKIVPFKLPQHRHMIESRV